jgi:putative transposase
MRNARAVGKSGSNELVLAELIRKQRQIESESLSLTRAERRSRERKGTLEGTNSAVATTEGLRAIDTGDTSRPLFKVERW